MQEAEKNVIQNFIRSIGRKGFHFLLLGIVSSMGVAIVELAISFSLQLLLSHLGFLSQPPKILGHTIVVHSLFFILCLLIGIAILRFAVQLFSGQSATFLRDSINHRLRKNLVHQMLYAQDSTSRSPSHVHFQLSEVVVKASEFAFNVSYFLFMFIQCFLLIVIMVLLAWKEAALAFLGIGIIGLVVIKMNKKVSFFAHQIPSIQQDFNFSVEKISRNFLFIKLMKKQNQERGFLNQLIEQYFLKSKKLNFFSQFVAQSGPFLGILLLTLIISVSQQFWHTESLALIAFIYLLARFVQSLSILSNYYGVLTIFYPQYKLALKSISNEDFERICEAKDLDSAEQNQNKAILNASVPEILFDQVAFSYRENKNVFSNLNFKIPAGAQFGIIGPSGTGKSTLLMLLAGVLKPSEGQILIDQLPAEEYVSLPHVRMGYVGAEPFLIGGTIRENVCYGLAVTPSEKEINDTLEMVSLADMLADKGLDFKIKEDHSGLSSGQKQRICLARALLNKPQVLILDEATSNLDEQNEKGIAEILKKLKGKCTTLIVSHRPGILIYADEIIDINNLNK